MARYVAVNRLGRGAKQMRSYRTWLRPILVGIALCGGAASTAHAVPTPGPCRPRGVRSDRR